MSPTHQSAALAAAKRSPPPPPPLLLLDFTAAVGWFRLCGVMQQLQHQLGRGGGGGGQKRKPLFFSLSLFPSACISYY